jgi:molybdopterin-biosynthesis enzyme MoeA-like protein
MAIGAYIIGDEIIRGRKQDRHFAKTVELLRARGLNLSWALYLGDDPLRIAAALRGSFAGQDIVFSFGGIGATPDDHTRACVAAALGVELEVHRDAAELIHAAMRKRTGGPANALQLEMGAFPRGAALIPNSFNGIPGFSIGEHFFMPGFPEMAWPMVEWVLDTRYPHLHHRRQESEAAIYVVDAMESTLTPLMRAIEEAHEGLKVFSLPHVGSDDLHRHVELGVRGDPIQVEAAMKMMRAEVLTLGGQWLNEPPKNG